jgi:hypothetical protein
MLITYAQSVFMNGMLEDTLRHFVGPFQRDWEELLPVVEFAMNNSWNASFQNTPFMLNYGQNPDDRTIAWLRERNSAVNKFVGRWSKQLVRARELLRAAQDKYKQHADRKKSDPPIYQPGDEVLHKTNYFRLTRGLTAKLAPRWVGPFKVIKAVGSFGLAYKIELPRIVQNMHPTLHVSALRPYKRSGPYQPPPLPEFIDGTPEWEVASIVDSRMRGKTREYLIRWQGWTNHDGWEPLRNLANCAGKVQEFWQSKGQPCPHPLFFS